MKKKIIMALLAATMITNMLVGCGGNQEAANGEDVTVKDETVKTQEKDVTAKDETVKTQEEEKVEVVNLSEKSNQKIEIDYNIDTYQPVQDFGFALFKENIQDTNPVLSPVSAYIALTMAGNGAQGNTKQEFENVLGKNEDMTAMSESMMHLLPKKTDRLTVELANSAWIDDAFTVKEEWIGQITSFYDAEAYQTDVSTQEAMNAMNTWIDKNTHGLIQKMIEQPFDPETRMVLFNTLYFKGKWGNPFTMESTYEEDFHISDTETVQVPMMHQSEEYYDFIETDTIKGIVMPYADSNLSFIALMPQGGMTIREVCEGLTAEGLSYLLEDRQNLLVNVKLPKFEVSFDKMLNDSLINMGLADAFDKEKADFSSLGTTDSGNPVYISLVRQKAVVKVDEEGTEAAAATEVAIMEACALLPENEPIDVFFDQPFLYLIMDMENQLPLFMGIMNNPVAE